MRRLLLVRLLFLVAAPSTAQAARFSVGDPQGRGRERRRTPGRGRERPSGDAGSARSRSRSRRVKQARSGPVHGVSWVERERASRRLSFTPNDPLAARQWYLSRIHAFDSWPQFPALEPVRVAVLDSGIDSAHPELAGPDRRRPRPSSPATGRATRTATARSSPARSLRRSTTARASPGVGFPADLLIAKIVRSDGTISPDAEARAIHWAVNHDARVINMSFGGVRDPHDPSQDTYSRSRPRPSSTRSTTACSSSRPSATRTARRPSRGATPAIRRRCRTSSASARSRRDGTVPTFSNRDVRYNDIAAPGEAILSTLPRALTPTSRPGCLPRATQTAGRSSSAAERARPSRRRSSRPEPRSCSPSDPSLQADQVSNLLTRSAVDATPDTGCIRCIDRPRLADRLGPAGHRERAGCPRQPAARAADRYEVNDQVANAAQLWGRKGQRIQRHDRLLGRPAGRLQGPARALGSARREAPRPRRHGHEPLPLEAGHEDRPQPRSPTVGSSPASRSRRAPRRRSA